MQAIFISVGHAGGRDVHVPMRIEVQAGQPLRSVLEAFDYPQIGSSVFDMDGVAIQFEGVRVRKALDIPQVLSFIAEIARDIDINLFKSRLVSKCKGSNRLGKHR